MMEILTEPCMLFIAENGLSYIMPSIVYFAILVQSHQAVRYIDYTVSFVNVFFTSLDEFSRFGC